jgi:hypothetical protein
MPLPKVAKKLTKERVKLKVEYFKMCVSRGKHQMMTLPGAVESVGLTCCT